MSLVNSEHEEGFIEKIKNRESQERQLKELREAASRRRAEHMRAITKKMVMKEEEKKQVKTEYEKERARLSRLKEVISKEEEEAIRESKRQVEQAYE